jgi:hypothetical protein
MPRQGENVSEIDFAFYALSESEKQRRRQNQISRVGLAKHI